ncbi:MAG: Rieske 2Fe-2S domain-containing protein [Pseudomonadales bacterium]|nr:Rieske 2Fe-2S domain-containing protein [Pseudomonadales bacterium]
MSEGFYVVAATDEIKEGGQMYVELDGTELLVCRHQGLFYAIAYYCSHAEFALEGGSMKNGCITCPYHGAEFRLEDGSVEAGPAFEPVRVYPVRVEDGVIKVCVS